MIFHQLQDPESHTFTYLLGCPQTRQAVLIDSVLDELPRYLDLLEEEGLALAFCLETHVHADHLTAAFDLKKRLGGIVVYGAAAPVSSDVMRVKDKDRLDVGTLQLTVMETPGHTDHDVSYHGNGLVFTGDCLLVGACGRTDFQSGSAHAMWHSITVTLFALPDQTRVYPGHDYHGHSFSTIGTERWSNARVSGKTEEEFVALMAHLNLPPPKKINVALPFNLAGSPHFG
jgi:glyoxylase-like metal-dependent hydrolase (beta-lactamase superfamily II)